MNVVRNLYVDLVKLDGVSAELSGFPFDTIEYGSQFDIHVLALAAHGIADMQSRIVGRTECLRDEPEGLGCSLGVDVLLVGSIAGKEF